MTKTPRPSAEIRADLAAAEARVAEIDRRMTEITAESAALARERNTLHARGYSHDSGQIPSLRRELDAAKRTEADATLPRLRIESYGRAEAVVVSRVTKKRIYTRRPGDTYEAIWTHAGLPESRWSSARLLDLDKIADLIAKAGAK